MIPELSNPTYSKARDLNIEVHDLNLRGLLVVGYAPQELLPPYSDIRHMTRARHIIEYSQHFSTVRQCYSPLQIFDTNIECEFPTQKVIEIVGGYADFCVPIAINLVAIHRRVALVRSKLLFSSVPSHSDSTLGSMVIRSVTRDMLCRINLGDHEYLYAARRTID